MAELSQIATFNPEQPIGVPRSDEDWLIEKAGQPGGGVHRRRLTDPLDELTDDRGNRSQRGMPRNCQASRIFRLPAIGSFVTAS